MTTRLIWCYECDGFIAVSADRVFEGSRDHALEQHRARFRQCVFERVDPAPPVSSVLSVGATDA